ncbi:MAG TPA: NADH-quinone oxidoreductase subunit C [Williamwhitmania sp.]|nr:NADH-quinone oxidoreductase subunit C [Williamwhitmania sp.]
MNKLELKEYLSSKFPAFPVEETIDFPVLRVPKEKIFATVKQLKEDDATQFNFLFCQTAVDYQPDLEMVYHLSSTHYRHDLMIKVTLSDRDKPTVDSITPIFTAAELFECEIFDLFGIHFDGFAGLRRLFMPVDWPGFPLRKDYVDNDMITR